MALRTSIREFSLANPLYSGATITFYTVDGTGAKTTTKATLYDSATGTGTLTNPQTLDSDGKLAAPVYLEAAVIATVSGLTTSDHDTGIIHTPGSWKGDWATATVYYAGEYVRAGAAADGTNDIYAVDETHTSGTFATDVSGGQLTLAIDVSTFDAIDALLTALAGLTTAADEMIYATGVDAFAMTSLTAFARTLLDDATAGAARATLGAGTGNGTMSNVVEDTTPQLGGDLDLNGNNIDFPTTANISDCLDEDNMASDSATMLATQQSIRAYVDATSSGIVLQAVSMTVAEASGTTEIPSDDTLPQSSEGTEIGTQAITMADNTNKVLITGAILLQPNDSDEAVAIALFRGTTCIATRALRFSGSNNAAVVSFARLDSPATAGSVTYSLRCGRPTGGSTTWQIGTIVGADYGDTADDGLILEEISA